VELIRAARNACLTVNDSEEHQKSIEQALQECDTAELKIIPSESNRSTRLKVLQSLSCLDLSAEQGNDGMHAWGSEDVYVPAQPPSPISQKVILNAAAGGRHPEKISQDEMTPGADTGSFTWMVALVEGALQNIDNGKWGFRTIGGREEFCRRLGIQAGPEVLMVREVFPSGPLATWNAEHPDAAVQVGDHILEVNGTWFAEDMQQELEDDMVLMRVCRNSPMFNVKLEKRGRNLGFTYKRPADGTFHEMLITSVLPGGVLAAHNALHAVGNRWDLVVLPVMRIMGVNGSAGCLTMMERELREEDLVELLIRRSVIAPVAPAMVAIRALLAMRLLERPQTLQPELLQKITHQFRESQHQIWQGQVLVLTLLQSILLCKWMHHIKM